MVYKTSFDEKIKRMDMVYYLMINQKVSFYFTLNSRENNTQRKNSIEYYHLAPLRLHLCAVKWKYDALTAYFFYRYRNTIVLLKDIQRKVVQLEDIDPRRETSVIPRFNCRFIIHISHSDLLWPFLHHFLTDIMSMLSLFMMIKKNNNLSMKIGQILT